MRLYSDDDVIEEYEMGGACGKYGEEGKCQTGRVWSLMTTHLAIGLACISPFLAMFIREFPWENI